MLLCQNAFAVCIKLLVDIKQHIRNKQPYTASVIWSPNKLCSPKYLCLFTIGNVFLCYNLPGHL